MARKGTIGYGAELLRKKGQRRVERLQSAINNKNATPRVIKWAKEQIREIKSAMQGTRQYSKTGKRYKSKTDRYIQRQISRLERAVAAVPQRYTVRGDSFEVTQRELNRASVNAPSVYIKTESKLFYRVTQKIWQVEGVGEHDRNQAILDYYNSIRKQNGLSPLRLDQIVDYVLEANKKYTDLLERMSKGETEDLDSEALEFQAKMEAADNDDKPKGSPPGIAEAVVSSIKDSLDELFVLPDPSEAF